MRRAVLAGAAIAWALAGGALADDVHPKDAGGARAPLARSKVLKQISLAPRWTPPIFYHSSRLALMDGGRALYIGRGALATPDLVYLLELDTLEQRMLTAPVKAFSTEHPELSLQPGLEDLLCYDRVAGVAGLQVEDTARSRMYFLKWDLAKDVVTKAILLGEKGPSTKWIGVQPIGYDPVRRECLLVVEKNDGPMPSPTVAGGPYAESVVAVGNAVRVIARFSAALEPTHRPYYDAAHRRAVVAEVSELEGAQPRGYLVDLANGGVRPFPIPQLVYGLAFSPDGRMLYAYGVKAHVLWAINTATGAAERRVRIGDSVHALGWLGTDTLVLAGNVRIHLIDPRTLGHRAQVPTGNIIPNLLTADGSMVLPDGLALVDFYQMAIARLEL